MRVDVAVIGAGIAGSVAFRLLKQAGVDAVLLDGGGSASLAGAPLLQVGTTEHPHRLEAALGLARARSYVGLSRRSGALLRELVPVTEGGWRLGVRDEAEELEAACEASLRLGLPCSLETTPMGLCRVVPEDGTADLSTLQPSHVQGRVEAIIEEGDRLRLQGTDIRCELVLLCGGWSLASLDGWFREKVYPVRGQLAVLDATAPTGGSGQYGHLYWAPVPEGLLVGGARWARQHMEVGETNPAPQPEVSERIIAWAHQHWPQAELLSERAGIMSFTCDNLPIVGPLPGRSRIIACTGFGENGLALGPACAEFAVHGVLKGRTDLPPFISASRFV